MSTKPILFSTDMVRALLANRKTVTRRVVKLKYSNTHLEMFTNKYGTRLIEKQNEESGVTTIRNPDGTTTRKVLAYIEKTPPYRPGDILYVRETFCWCPCWDCGMDLEEGCCDETAEKFYNTEKFEWGCYGYKASFQEGEVPFDGWRPSIHMPREAARIFLRVTDVRAERLQDSFFKYGNTIFYLQREGIDIGEHCRECIDTYGSPICNDRESECGMLDEVRGGFSDLWDSTIRPADRTLYGWAANPWIWVIEFERISREEALLWAT